MFFVFGAHVLQDLDVIFSALGLTVQDVGQHCHHTQLFVLTVLLNGVLGQNLLHGKVYMSTDSDPHSFSKFTINNLYPFLKQFYEFEVK